MSIRQSFRLILPLAAFLLAPGCATDKAHYDGIARAALGETTFVDGPKVMPVRLLEDSRCPEKVQCVWAGQVRLEIRVTLGSGDQIRELTLGAPIHVADGDLTLIEVTPPKRKDGPISPKEYRFGFKFAGGL